MKKSIFLLVLFPFTFLSCSHIAIYKEARYVCNDSPYPITQHMQFAYYAGDRNKLSSSMVQTGNRIFDEVQEDTCFVIYLPSAEQFVIDNDTFKTYRATYLETIKNCSDVLKSMRSSSNHKSAIDNGREQLKKLSVCAKYNFNDYWKRIYQLSHRGILQHYMTSYSGYNGLSSIDKSLLYGYLLKEDNAKCTELASISVSKENKTINGLRTGIEYEVSRHKNILEENDRREKAERERQYRENVRRNAELFEQREREAKQRRWNDDSWVHGSWCQESSAGTVSFNIDARDQTIVVKMRAKNSIKSYTIYNGSYYMYDGSRATFSDHNSCGGYRVIKFANSKGYILANPNDGHLYGVDRARIDRCL